jgi:hypothetical protein
MQDYPFLEYLPEKFRNDKTIVLRAVQKNGLNIQYTSDLLKREKEIILAALFSEPTSIIHFSSEFRANKEFVLLAFDSPNIRNRDENLLKFVDHKLKADKEVVLAAINQNGFALKFAAENLRADKEVVLSAVNKNGSTLEYASENLRADKDIVLAAVKRNGEAIQFASDDLKAHREIVFAAVSNWGYSLQFIPENLRTDKELVLAAVNNNGLALEFASADLKADNDVILAAVYESKEALEFANDIIYSKSELIYKILNIESIDIEEDFPQNVQNKIFNSKIFLTELVKKNRYYLGNANDEFKNNKEIVSEAVNNEPGSFEYAHKDLKTISFTLELIDKSIKVGYENYPFYDGKSMVSKYERLKQKKSWLCPFYRAYILWKY